MNLHFQAFAFSSPLKRRPQGNQPVRHDIQKRRTLKHKSVLLKQYGVYALSSSFALFCAWSWYRQMQPPEYHTEEEREKANQKFGIQDAINRAIGYSRAMRERSDNKQELKEVRLPK